MVITTTKLLMILVLITTILSGTLVYMVFDRLASLDSRITAIEQAAQPTSKQVLLIGTTDTVTTLDPAHININWELMIDHLVYEPLVTWSKNATLKPLLATDYEFSSDGLSCTLRLRTGVKFTDGTPFNASVVKFNFERTISEHGIGAYFTGPIDTENPVTIVDDNTVRINLKTSMPAIYPQILAIGFGNSVYSSSACTSAGKEWGVTVFVGSGPFYVSEWRKSQYTILKRNDNYWGAKPKLEEIIIKEFQDTTALRLALEAGEVDLAMNTRWAPSDIQSLTSNPYIESHMTVGGAGYERWIHIDPSGRFPPLNNSLVRQAIAYAVDKDRLLNVAWKKEGSVFHSLVPSYAAPYYLNSWQTYYPTNKTKAKELLAQAGYANGFSTTLVYTSSHYNVLDRDAALLIQDDLAQIGITVELKEEEMAAFNTIRVQQGVPLGLAGFCPDYPDPDNILSSTLVSYGFYGPILRGNFSRLDELVLLAASESNVTKRVQYYNEVQTIAANDVWFIPLTESIDRAFNKFYVRNFVLPPLVGSWAAAFMDVYIQRTS